MIRATWQCLGVGENCSASCNDQQLENLINRHLINRYTPSAESVSTIHRDAAMSQKPREAQLDASKQPNEEIASSNAGASDPIDSADESTSPGVARIQGITRHITPGDRVALFIGVFLIAYAYGLDGQIRNTYQVGVYD